MWCFGNLTGLIPVLGSLLGVWRTQGTEGTPGVCGGGETVEVLGMCVSLGLLWERGFEPRGEKVMTATTKGYERGEALGTNSAAGLRCPSWQGLGRGPFSPLPIYQSSQKCPAHWGLGVVTGGHWKAWGSSKVPWGGRKTGAGFFLAKVSHPWVFLEITLGHLGMVALHHSGWPRVTEPWRCDLTCIPMLVGHQSCGWHTFIIAKFIKYLRFGSAFWAGGCWALATVRCSGDNRWACWDRTTQDSEWTATRFSAFQTTFPADSWQEWEVSRPDVGYPLTLH